MVWNIAAECISLVVLCIIWVYSKSGRPIPNLKNRLFQASFLTTFCSMFTNILSTYLLQDISKYTIVFAWIVTLIYFIATPLMGMVYCFYTIAHIFEGNPYIKRYCAWASMPGLLYVLMLIANIFTHNIFNITISEGYSQGKHIMATYIVFYFYCLLCVIFVAMGRKTVAPSIRVILYSFPIIAFAVILFQMFTPNIVLTGSAATCAILLIYLYLQNKQLSIDHLTDIPNRQEFLNMMSLNLKKNIPFGVLVLSLREFKNINDTYGQHNGDVFLKAVSIYLKKELNLKEGRLYRYSGDEFAIILSESDKENEAAIVDKITTRMTKPWGAKDSICILSAAIGIVWYPQTSEVMEELINGIEYSVSYAKKDSSNQYVCHCTPELVKKSRRHQMVTEILKQRIKTEGFDVFYQPIYNVNSNSFTSAEALLRLNDTELGYIPPNEFIPIAEETGLIIDITYLVLDKVCRQIREMMEKNISLDEISINFSALQFTQKNLIEKMVEIITKYEIPFSKIKIEITESTLAENIETVSEFVSEMHRLGIHIALDDFGTGYSNLVAVIDLPIDTVKLDKSLVWSATNSRSFSIVVQNFTRAFRELDMTVLAEGIENEKQSEFVIECGCGLIQGFLYAKPMPYTELESFLISHIKTPVSL